MHIYWGTGFHTTPELFPRRSPPVASLLPVLVPLPSCRNSSLYHGEMKAGSFSVDGAILDDGLWTNRLQIPWCSSDVHAEAPRPHGGDDDGCRWRLLSSWTDWLGIDL